VSIRSGWPDRSADLPLGTDRPRAVLNSGGRGGRARLRSAWRVEDARGRAYGARERALAASFGAAQHWFTCQTASVGWAKPRKRRSRPKDGVASLAYAHVFVRRKTAWGPAIARRGRA
jgi:hypothetical protein